MGTLAAMRVMLTGATGFVGSHTARAVDAAGHDLSLLVRSSDKAAAVLGEELAGRCRLVVGDMTDTDAVAEALDGADACIHTAAVVSVSSGGGDLSKNTDGARVVLGSAVAAGCDPVIYTSTTAIFIPSPDPVITPDSPLADPRSNYGKSKIGAEHYCRGLADAGAPIVVVYPGGVIGPDQPVLDSSLEGFGEAVSKGLPVVRTGGVTIIDVRDLAAAMVALLTPGGGAKRVMAGGHFYSWSGLGDLLESVTGSKVRRIPVRPAALRGMGAVLDAARKVRDIEWPVNREVAEIMSSMCDSDDSSLAELGITLRSAEESMADSMRWMVEAGHLAPEFAPKLT